MSFSKPQVSVDISDKHRRVTSLVAHREENFSVAAARELFAHQRSRPRLHRRIIADALAGMPFRQKYCRARTRSWDGPIYESPKLQRGNKECGPI